MAKINVTDMTLSVFILNGIPGLEEAHIWISIPFCSMYIIAMVGNCGLLYLIRIEGTLHKPMYYFLSMLSLTDIGLVTSVVPKAMCIFWFKMKKISFNACLTQMFFIHTFTGMESGVLMLMSLDRYVAICYPLRYASILTNPVITTAGVVTFLRGVMAVIPVVVFTERLPYCHTNIIPHTYCDHMSVVKLACASIRVDAIYGLVAALVIGGFDIFCIFVSYAMILRAVVGLSSKEARSKTFSTCTAHICAIITSYTPALFSILTHRFGSHHITAHTHILIANLYLLLPPMLNTIVYGVKTKQIRESVLKLFSAGKAGSSPGA
ncbi:PREDICTED: olfactory receptor 52N4-like [Crocodylus porosus]|uniref:olfactory receptor 52N4-like n=1 Tax=Crocodylus porosus TaxID=8502 RepID=UPI00093FA764|nr:PREDICTED: olfactory receptor 52N4-like [Crocodylus porosus]